MMSSSSTSGDLPPPAAARPLLPVNASPSSGLAVPSKKRKTAHLDGANPDAMIPLFVTPPNPTNNVARGGMPPRRIALPPVAATVGHVEVNQHLTDVVTNYGHGETLGRTLGSYSQLAYNSALVP